MEKLIVDCSGERMRADRRVQRVPLDHEEIEQREIDADAAPDVEAIMLRARRNGLLTSSDWTQVQDAPLTDIQRASWADYRQALRDTPLGPWPDPPQ